MCMQGVAKGAMILSLTTDDFIEGTREPVRRSIIAMNRYILYA